MIKILHTADIHLDSPFALESPALSNARKKELREAFTAMMNYVRSNDIRLLLISGDLFDFEYATKETIELVLSEFRKTPECEIVIAPGNHDPYTESGIYRNTPFPENVHIFTSEAPECFSFPEFNTDVYGYAFTSKHMEKSPIASIKIKDTDRINILCAHADTSSAISKYAPLTEAEIEKSGLDYLALGHIHNGGRILRAGATRYAYSGSLEGRDFGECGYKGAITGILEKNKFGFSADLIGQRFSRRRYASETVNITGAADISDVVKAINEVITKSGYGEDTLLRVTLEGDVSPDLIFSQSLIAEKIPPLFSFSLINTTIPLYNHESLINDPTIRGALFEQLLPRLESESVEDRETASLALRYALSALDGADILGG